MGAGPAYEFVEGATSDLFFVAHGPTLEDVFAGAAQALLAATVEDPGSVARRECRTVRCEEPDLELLLLRFLNELVYLRAFARHRLLTPRRILGAGWDFLVNPVMREGGYVRYDGGKSTQILRDCETLLSNYRGSLTRLQKAAADAPDLEARLSSFYGVGPVTTNIFLRELRPIWRKADPDPLPIVRERARRAGIDLGRFGRHTLTFARIEAGVLGVLSVLSVVDAVRRPR